MKKLTIIIALAVAAIATAGQLMHPLNPLTVAGKAISVEGSIPFPVCPPSCGELR